jgi:hypothetical protein
MRTLIVSSAFLGSFCLAEELSLRISLMEVGAGGSAVAATVHLLDGDDVAGPHNQVGQISPPATDYRHADVVTPPKRVAIRVNEYLCEVVSRNPVEWGAGDVVFKVRSGGVPHSASVALENRGIALLHGDVGLAAYATYTAATLVDPGDFPRTRNRLESEAIILLNRTAAFGVPVPLIEEGNGVIVMTRDFREKLSEFQRSDVPGSEPGRLGEATFATVARKFGQGNRIPDLRGEMVAGNLAMLEQRGDAVELPEVWGATGVPNPRVVFMPRERATWRGYDAVIAGLVENGDFGDAAWLSWHLQDRAARQGASQEADAYLRSAYRLAARRVELAEEGEAYTVAGTKVFPSDNLRGRLNEAASMPRMAPVGNAQFESLKTIEDFKPMVMDALKDSGIPE